MNATIIILRLIHIISGVIWASGSIMMTSFVGPSANAVGKDAAKFMQQLSFHSPFGPTMAVTALLTTLSGVSLYWIIFGEINVASTSGLMLTIGGVLGIIAFIMGFTTQNNNTDKMRVIADEIAVAGGPPKPEQMAAMAELQEKQAKSGAILTIIMFLTIAFMTLS